MSRAFAAPLRAPAARPTAAVGEAWYGPHRQADRGRADPGPGGGVLGRRARAVPGRRAGARPAARPASRTTSTSRPTPGRPRSRRCCRRAGADSIYAIGEKFGTIGGIFGEDLIEITTYRSEEYEPGSRKPKVEFGDSLEGDLSRRDFTINAIALDVRTGELVGPVRRPGRPEGPADPGRRGGRGAVRRGPAAAAARRSAGGAARVRDRARDEAGRRRLRRDAGDDQPRAGGAGDGEDPDESAAGARDPAADRPGPDAADHPRGAGDARHAPGRQLPPQGRLRAHRPGGGPDAAAAGGALGGAAARHRQAAHPHHRRRRSSTSTATTTSGIRCRGRSCRG